MGKQIVFKVPRSDWQERTNGEKLYDVFQGIKIPVKCADSGSKKESICRRGFFSNLGLCQKENCTNDGEKMN